MLAYLVRAWRWQFLLIGVGHIPLRSLWSSIMIGFMGNNILPARLGELLRAYSLGRSAGVSRSAALASVVVERILDIGVLLLIFGTVFVHGPASPGDRPLGRDPAGAGRSGGRSFSSCSSFARSRSGGWWSGSCPDGCGRGCGAIAMNFRDGLRVLRHPVPLLAGIGLSILMWGILVGGGHAEPGGALAHDRARRGGGGPGGDGDRDHDPGRSGLRRDAPGGGDSGSRPVPRAAGLGLLVHGPLPRGTVAAGDRGRARPFHAAEPEPAQAGRPGGGGARRARGPGGRSRRLGKGRTGADR